MREPFLLIWHDKIKRHEFLQARNLEQAPRKKRYWWILEDMDEI